MDNSSIDETLSSTSDSLTISTSTPPPPITHNNTTFNLTTPFSSVREGSSILSTYNKSVNTGCLSRMGSGTSVIIDSVNGVESESIRKLPSSKYKGVVPQPNGRWGAQIYEKHQRVWLGTFNEEAEAARAYDVAAQRFRGRDAVTNFKTLSSETEFGVSELRFLNSRSKAEIVDMLRKHTYLDELQQNRRNFNTENNKGSNIFNLCDKIKPSNGNVKFGRQQLFEKVVTPSDVGKLNRLVIPKQHAEKHFPLSSGKYSLSSSSPSKGVLLNFEDVDEKVWRFRYSYWNSSQSYVLTKGWSRFVKEKNLKAGDIVSFMRSSEPHGQLYIDFKKKSIGSRSGCEGPIEVKSTRQIVRLFGVDICKAPLVMSMNVVADTAASGGGNGKRLREVELLGLESSCKKQILVAAL